MKTPTSDNILRHVKLPVDGYTLQLWDTGKMKDASHPRLGYKLTAPGGAVLFTGEDFGASPLHAIDSDETLRGLCSFLFLRPGDTDAEYFADYTPEQLAFAQSYDCEYMAALTADDSQPEQFQDIPA